MLTNYLKIAWRNLIRQRVFSTINILGLSFGLASCLLLLGYVKHEKSYDDFHPEASQVYRVVQEVNGSQSWAWTGGAVAPMLRKEFPEKLDQVVSLIKISTYLESPEGLTPEEKFREDRFFFADPGFEQVFGFSLKAGSWDGLLENPFQLAITETAAKKYFGDENPVGKVLVSTGDFSFEVKAVLADLPSNTHLNFYFLTGMNSFKLTENFPVDADFGSFWWPQTYTYVRVNEFQSADKISEEIPLINPNYRNPEEAKSFVHFLQPIQEIHTDDSFTGDLTPAASNQSLLIFLFIGVFILVLACINFINLATARAIKRMKEIGVRKVNGAHRSQLILQFLIESFLINGVSVLLGMVLAKMMVPALESKLALTIPLNLLDEWVIILSVWIISSVLAGFFPAFYLSGIQPEMILKQSFIHRGKGYLRKSLVVFQFVLSTLLVFSASVTFFQHRFLIDSPLGFEPVGVLAVQMGSQAKENGEVLKQELSKIPGVASVKFTSDRPGIDSGWNPSVDYPGIPEGKSSHINVQYVDAGYFEALGIPLVAGREFNEGPADGGVSTLMRERFPELNGVAIVINESAMEWMEKDHETVLGSDVRVFTEENGQLFSNYKGKVVGVVQDYHTRDLRFSIPPTVYLPAKNAAFDGTSYVLIHGEKSIDSDLLEKLKSTWMTVNEGLPFDYRYLDESIAMQYQQQAQTSTLLGIFAVLALVISCLGLLGLSIFTAESRRKEIGIRRVLGASAGSIVQKLASEFLVLVLISLILALPIGYYLMQGWLEQFSLKVTLGPGFYLLAALVSTGMALATISIQSLKSAHANPVESIRTE